MITINDAIEMMPKGWTLIRFNHEGDVMYKKGSARLARKSNGTWSCEVYMTDMTFYTTGVEKTPEAAITCVQEQITRSITQCAKLLSDLTGVEV